MRLVRLPPVACSACLFRASVVAEVCLSVRLRVSVVAFEVVQQLQDVVRVFVVDSMLFEAIFGNEVESSRRDRPFREQVLAVLVHDDEAARQLEHSRLGLLRQSVRRHRLRLSHLRLLFRRDRRDSVAADLLLAVSVFEGGRVRLNPVAAPLPLVLLSQLVDADDRILRNLDADSVVADLLAGRPAL